MTDKPDLKETASEVLDALVYPRRDFEAAWKQLCLLCGRYCEPYLSWIPPTPGEAAVVAEWRRWMREAQQDIEVLQRVRDNLLKRLDDQRAEFSFKEAELKRLREQTQQSEKTS